MPEPQCIKNHYKGSRPSYRFSFRDELVERHHWPHIHVFGPEFGKLVISLVDLTVLAPPHVSPKCPLREITAVIRKHREALLDELAQLRREGSGHDDSEL